MNLICLLINCNSINLITKLLNDIRSNKLEIDCIMNKEKFWEFTGICLTSWTMTKWNGKQEQVEDMEKLNQHVNVSCARIDVFNCVLKNFLQNHHCDYKEGIKVKQIITKRPFWTEDKLICSNLLKPLFADCKTLQQISDGDNLGGSNEYENCTKNILKAIDNFNYCERLSQRLDNKTKNITGLIQDQDYEQFTAPTTINLFIEAPNTSLISNESYIFILFVIIVCGYSFVIYFYVLYILAESF